jgi:superfamily II DNA or RNA helicase
MPTLYDYQKDAVEQLLNGKHFVISGTGSGKGATAVVWAKAVCERENKKNVLVVTTASKSRTNDFQSDADLCCCHR